MSVSRKANGWAMVGGLPYLRQPAACAIVKAFRTDKYKGVDVPGFLSVDKVDTDDLFVGALELWDAQTAAEKDNALTIVNNMRGVKTSFGFVTRDMLKMAKKRGDRELAEKYVAEHPAQAIAYMGLWFKILHSAIRCGIVKPNCTTPTASAGVSKAVYASIQ